jgi:hypothetical protein
MAVEVTGSQTFTSAGTGLMASFSCQ